MEIFKVGTSYIIHTVTMIYVGTVVEVDNEAGFVRLKDASWIAETARWSETLAYGTVNESEPYTDDLFLAIGSIVTHTQWNHPLPMDKK